MLPIACLPITEHQIVKAKRAGITSLVLATSYLSEVFIPYFGDGSKWGMQIQYAVEVEPLGTGGGIKNAASLLNTNESIVILNGDVLSSHDLASQIIFHEERDADVTLHLTNVADARAFGCVPVDSQGRVEAFLEKMENPVASTINAGCYIFHPRVISTIESGRSVSVEREVFPQLVESGRPVYGYLDDSYWLDLGTPVALLKGSSDVVRGIANSDALSDAGVRHTSKDFALMSGGKIHSTAHVINGSSIGHNSKVGATAMVAGSILCSDVEIEEGAKVVNSFVEKGEIVKAGMDISDSYVGPEGIQKL